MRPGRLVTCAGWLSLAWMLVFAGHGVRVEAVAPQTPAAPAASGELAPPAAPAASGELAPPAAPAASGELAPGGARR